MMRFRLLGTATLLAGCAALKPAEAPVTMRLSPAVAASAPTRAGSVSVASVIARGFAGDRRYAYVTAAAPGEVRQAATLFWEEPPPRVIERALVAALRGVYPQVYGPEVTLAADRRVVTTLVRFEEAGAGATGEAVVGLDASVVAAGKLERSGRYCGRAPIADASGTARARAFEAAVAGAVTAFVQERAGGC